MKAEMTPPADIARAYDTIAADYDQQVNDSQWMRAILWQTYQRYFRPGQRVLDLSCGTGIDALYLAQGGVRVTGIDLSPGMIVRLKAKASHLGLEDRVEACVFDLNHLEDWTAEPYDGMISAFAGLNTLNDLAGLSRAAARLLKPGGHFIAHLLNRFNIWTWLEQVRHGQIRTALQASRQGIFHALIGEIPVWHALYYPKEAYQRFFKPEFQLVRYYSLGAVRPLSASPRLPGALLDGLGWLDRSVGGMPPFRNCGRFFVLEMTRRSN